MFHIALVDSELETVPQELWGHQSVLKQARRRGKKPGNILLDSNFHHAAIKKYFPGEENRRGRPDIVQYFLLNTLESPLNLSGNLKVYVHTRENKVIFFDPSTRIPKSYNRFIGLMEDLFHNHYVPSSNKPLLSIFDMDINGLIQKIKPSKIVVLNEKGNKIKIDEIIEDNMFFLIGGFPSGDFISNLNSFLNISIYHLPLPAWVVAYELVTSMEKFLGIF